MILLAPERDAVTARVDDDIWRLGAQTDQKHW